MPPSVSPRGGTATPRQTESRNQTRFLVRAFTALRVNPPDSFDGDRQQALTLRCVGKHPAALPHGFPVGALSFMGAREALRRALHPEDRRRERHSNRLSGRVSAVPETGCPGPGNASWSYARCICRCVDGQMVPICTNIIDLPPICPPTICPLVPPSIPALTTVQQVPVNQSRGPFAARLNGCIARPIPGVTTGSVADGRGWSGRRMVQSMRAKLFSYLVVGSPW